MLRHSLQLSIVAQDTLMSLASLLWDGRSLRLALPKTRPWIVGDAAGILLRERGALAAWLSNSPHRESSTRRRAHGRSAALVGQRWRSRFADEVTADCNICASSPAPGAAAEQGALIDLNRRRRLILYARPVDTSPDSGRDVGGDERRQEQRAGARQQKASGDVLHRPLLRHVSSSGVDRRPWTSLRALTCWARLHACWTMARCSCCASRGSQHRLSAPPRQSRPLPGP